MATNSSVDGPSVDERSWNVTDSERRTTGLANCTLDSSGEQEVETES
jgi:hypothetical protein